MAPAKAVDILVELDHEQAIPLLRDLDPPQAGALLSSLSAQQRQELLAGVAPAEARQLRSLMDYPADSAGRLMDPRIAVFRPGMTGQCGRGGVSPTCCWWTRRGVCPAPFRCTRSCWPNRTAC